MSAPEAGSIRRLVGLVLLVIGVLWMGAAGLCSGAFFVSILVEGAGFREILSIVPMIGLVGGFGAGIGLVIYIVGRALRPKV
jgi:hypothetical protein